MRFIFYFLIFCSFINSQINFLFEGKEIDLNDTIIFKGDTLVINRVAFYYMEITDDKDTLFRLYDSGHNVNLLLNSSSQYYLGVDSLTFERGTMEGDLDPINGMFWTWQTAYIHLKIEGSISSSSLHQNAFIYHIGGNKGVYNTCLPWKGLSKDTPEFIMDLSYIARLLSQKEFKIMQPGKKAFNFASNFLKDNE